MGDRYRWAGRFRNRKTGQGKGNIRFPVSYLPKLPIDLGRTKETRGWNCESFHRIILSHEIILSHQLESYGSSFITPCKPGILFLCMKQEAACFGRIRAAVFCNKKARRIFSGLFVLHYRKNWLICRLLPYSLPDAPWLLLPPAGTDDPHPPGTSSSGSYTVSRP